MLTPALFLGSCSSQLFPQREDTNDPRHGDTMTEVFNEDTLLVLLGIFGVLVSAFLAAVLWLCWPVRAPPIVPEPYLWTAPVRKPKSRAQQLENRRIIEYALNSTLRDEKFVDCTGPRGLRSSLVDAQLEDLYRKIRKGKDPELRLLFPEIHAEADRAGNELEELFKKRISEAKAGLREAQTDYDRGARYEKAVSRGELAVVGEGGEGGAVPEGYEMIEEEELQRVLDAEGEPVLDEDGLPQVKLVRIKVARRKERERGDEEPLSEASSWEMSEDEERDGGKKATEAGVAPSERESRRMESKQSSLPVSGVSEQSTTPSGETVIGTLLAYSCRCLPPAFWHRLVRRCVDFYRRVRDFFLWLWERYIWLRGKFGAWFVTRVLGYRESSAWEEYGEQIAERRRRREENWDENGPIRIFPSGFPHHLHTICTSVTN